MAPHKHISYVVCPIHFLYLLIQFKDVVVGGGGRDLESNNNVDID